jgi:hypothetical protein
LKNKNLKPIAGHFKLFSIPVQPTISTCDILSAFGWNGRQTSVRFDVFDNKLHYITEGTKRCDSKYQSHEVYHSRHCMKW